MRDRRELLAEGSLHRRAILFVLLRSTEVTFDNGLVRAKYFARRLRGDGVVAGVDFRAGTISEISRIDYTIPTCSDHPRLFSRSPEWYKVLGFLTFRTAG